MATIFITVFPLERPGVSGIGVCSFFRASMLTNAFAGESISTPPGRLRRRVNEVVCWTWRRGDDHRIGKRIIVLG